MALTRDEIEEVEGWVKSPTLTKLIRQIEDKYQATWRLARSTEDREYCWRMIQCINQVLAEMQSIVDAQRITQHNDNRKNFSFNNVKKPEDLQA
jgi:hypothetical protein